MAENLPSMNDVCQALVDNAAEFLKKNYGDEVLEQITDMVMVSIKDGDGDCYASVICRSEKSFNIKGENNHA